MLKNTHNSYGTISKAFHWGMAALVLAMLGIGFFMGGMPASLTKLKTYNLHKSLGVTVLALVVLRMLWHLYAPRPALLALHAWERLAARAGHAALYFFMLAMPLSGWAMSAAAGRPVSFFGLFTLPDIAPANPAIQRICHDIHEICALGLLAMVAAHFAAALKHHIIDKDDTLRRMLPF